MERDRGQDGEKGGDVMRHCMVVKREMGEVESKLCLIQMNWSLKMEAHETTWGCGSGEEYDLLTDLHV